MDIMVDNGLYSLKNYTPSGKARHTSNLELSSLCGVENFVLGIFLFGIEADVIIISVGVCGISSRGRLKWCFILVSLAGDWKGPTQPLDGRERRLARVKDSRLARAKIFRVKDSPGLSFRIVLPCAGPSIASVEHGLRRSITTDKNTRVKKVVKAGSQS